MVNTEPYLPDILKEIVAKVSAKTYSFEPILNDEGEQTSGPFKCSFDYGIYSQVSRNLYALTVDDSEIYPLFWLVMDWDEQSGKDFTIHSRVTFDVIIAAPTDKDYTSEERTNKVFKPILLPAYEVFINELVASKAFVNVSSSADIPKRKKLRPYWGGGYINSGGDTKNLFEKEIDAILIQSIQLDLEINNFC